ncbi:MAG: hypothetical protein JWM60_1673 [Solirubrobacterales bacterium]|nr:hypothetical protein [Solirubrobacterales bacterium]
MLTINRARRMRTTLIAATVLVFGLFVSSAAARYHRPAHHPSTDPVALALTLGERYWHASPCNGSVRVVSSTEFPTEVTGAAVNSKIQAGAAVLLAWTSFETPDGPNEIKDKPAQYTDCQIALNGNLWRTWWIDDGEFHWLCDLMTHELGHLFGYPDEGQTDPRSVTYPVLEPESPNFNSVPQCRHVTLWYGNRRLVG